MGLKFTEERIVPEADNCEPHFAEKLYMEHICRYYFASQFVPGKKVLDIGCGVGYGAQLLARRGAEHVDAFDIDASAIEHAKQFYGNDNVSYYCASAVNFDSGEGKYDVITCFELIEHVAEQRDVLRNIRKAIKPDGMLVISTPRPLGKKRAVFHVRELNQREFIELITEQLPYYNLFSQNNHFTSLITNNPPPNELRPIYMKDQFALSEADYFICVASANSLDNLNINHSFVVNDDKYVLLQELDVAILHEAEDFLRAKLQNINTNTEDMLSRIGLIDEKISKMGSAANEEARDILGSICYRIELIDEKIAKVDRHLLLQRLFSVYHNYVKIPVGKLLAKTRRPVDIRQGKETQQREAQGKDAVTCDVAFVYGLEGAVKRYRADNIIEGLQKLGFSAISLPENMVSRLASDIKPKVVVFVRCADIGALCKPIIQSLRGNNVKFFCDYDDLIFEPEIIHTVDGVNYLNDEQKEEYKRGVFAYREFLKYIAAGTTTTSFLASRMARLVGEAHVIPNSLNKAQLDFAERILSEPKKKLSGCLTIVYGSGSMTHQKDFLQCADALARFLRERRDSKFLLIGELELPASFSDLNGHIIRKPLLPYLELLKEISTADINIAPLENVAFNDSKSELKIFEAGVVCVPTIASPTDSYAACIDDGVDGVLADSTEDWYNAFCRLADNLPLREGMGIKAREKACSNFNYVNVAKTAASVYGLRLPDNVDEKRLSPISEKSLRFSEKLDFDHLKIAWVLPSLAPNSGGIRNILRAAYYLSEFGHKMKLYIIRTDKTSKESLELIKKNYYPIDCEVFSSPSNVFNIADSDALFATHWSTVETVIDNRLNAKELMYFVQDFEPLFSPMGSEYVLAENTYRQGLYHITSGPWCERFLRRDFGAEADHFLFPLDTNVYYQHRRIKKNPNIVFFAKPEMPRRCYELGVAALKEFHSYMPETEIIFFGSSNVNKHSVPFPVTLLSTLPVLEDLANLYSNADLGLVFSTTNPSLVPYEMMACGLPVIDLNRGDNHCNYGERFDIALLADPRPNVMAQQMIGLLNDPEELGKRRKNGIEFVKNFPTEVEMARKIEELIKKRLMKENIL